MYGYIPTSKEYSSKLAAKRYNMVCCFVCCEVLPASIVIET